MKRIGIVSHRFARPLTYGLRRQADPPTLVLVESGLSGTADLALKLRREELDAAFLSPLDYAKEYSRLRIVPSVCVFSERESGGACLLFRESLPRVNTIGVDPSAGSEAVLAHLVFAEKYDTAPTLVPLPAPSARSLEQADAVLLVGDAALEASGAANKLDLAEEWNDMTGFPYVHGFWAAPEGALTLPEMEHIVESGREGASRLDERSADTAYLNRFGYELNERALAALAEFFRMAYYHGVLKDIPDVKLHDLEGQASSRVRHN